MGWEHTQNGETRCPWGLFFNFHIFSLFGWTTLGTFISPMVKSRSIFPKVQGCSSSTCKALLKFTLGNPVEGGMTGPSLTWHGTWREEPSSTSYDHPGTIRVPGVWPTTIDAVYPCLPLMDKHSPRKSCFVGDLHIFYDWDNLEVFTSALWDPGNSSGLFIIYRWCTYDGDFPSHC